MVPYCNNSYTKVTSLGAGLLVFPEQWNIVRNCLTIFCQQIVRKTCLKTFITFVAQFNTETLKLLWLNVSKACKKSDVCECMWEDNQIYLSSITSHKILCIERTIPPLSLSRFLMFSRLFRHKSTGPQKTSDGMLAKMRKMEQGQWEKQCNGQSGTVLLGVHHKSSFLRDIVRGMRDEKEGNI